ncbi:sodium/proton antiporter, CPA1 family [Sphingomonas gellani]|uniref:Sodium/proton antiporter, CPA1 family n=1 Tax=Sphingomonas gellani TaxID=1166340 RepID=A0A1H8HBV7_9SPHN|nr:sodium:proton antiporter [Sphingomonas gellani]SEN53731.1 sodium/proton antiporter, CPA1 family [Sphingomonas gellani]
MQDLDLPAGFEPTSIGALLLLAALVAIASVRLRLPYSVALVAAGLILAVAAPGSVPMLSRDLIFLVFLPPLVFEAAIQIPWKPFRRELPLLSALVTLGVVLAAAIVAGGMHWLAGWSWIGAGLFGVLVAATDPVSVIAAFKQMPVPHRLHLLVESESLLNDGTAAVGFAVLAGIAAGGDAGATTIALKLVGTVLGGIACGLGVSFALVLLAGRTQDRLVEVMLTTLIAYGSFLLAEHLGGSGVIATLTAGLVVGNYGFLGSFSDSGREGVLNHWEFVAFLVNSLVFLLIGGAEAAVPIGTVLFASAAAIALSLIGRAVAVYPVMIAFARSRLSVPWAYKHVLFWGGLRGALALALALALPAGVAEREEIVWVTFAVVAFSIVVQGITMPALVRRLGLFRATRA